MNRTVDALLVLSIGERFPSCWPAGNVGQVLLSAFRLAQDRCFKLEVESVCSSLLDNDPAELCKFARDICVDRTVMLEKLVVGRRRGTGPSGSRS